MLEGIMAGITTAASPINLMMVVIGEAAVVMPPMLTRDRIGALIMLAFSIGYGLMIFRIPLLPFQAQVAFTARTMPQALCLLGIVLSLVLLFKPASGETAVKVAGLKWKTAAALCALMVFYGFTIRDLGFLISTNVTLRRNGKWFAPAMAGSKSGTRAMISSHSWKSRKA